MRRIEVGLLIAEFGSRSPAVVPRESTAERLSSIIERALRAEQLGFDSVWLDGDTPHCDDLRAPAVLLAAIATRTTTLRLGAGVPLCAGLDPLRIAEDVATLDTLSSGRVEVVVSERGFAMPSEGAPTGDAESCDRLRETVELLRRLWTETDVCWSGRIRAPLERVTVQPRPVQQPHPPIWIGTGGDPRAGALAAALHLPSLLPFGSGPAPGGRSGACSLVSFGASDPGRQPGAIRGSADEVAEQLRAARAARDLDVQLVCFDPTGRDGADAAEDLERFGREVLPALRKA